MNRPTFALKVIAIPALENVDYRLRVKSIIRLFSGFLCKTLGKKYREIWPNGKKTLFLSPKTSRVELA